MHNKYSGEFPSPSTVYVTPGVWLSSPVAEWIMVIHHCGPAPLYNIGVYFADDDRKRAMAGRSTVTPEEIAETETSLHFPEIDPTQNGPMFTWRPLDQAHGNYTIRIQSRDSIFDESLKIQRIDEKWHYSVTVADVTKSQPLKVLDCRDRGFTASSTGEHVPACFPDYVVPAHRDSCG
jgi:hypothetical protein